MPSPRSAYTANTRQRYDRCAEARAYLCASASTPVASILQRDFSAGVDMLCVLALLAGIESGP